MRSHNRDGGLCPPLIHKIWIIYPFYNPLNHTYLIAKLITNLFVGQPLALPGSAKYTSIFSSLEKVGTMPSPLMQQIFIYNRPSKCHLHYLQRWCKLSGLAWTCVLSIQCFVLNYLFCAIFVLFLFKGSRKPGAKVNLMFCNSIYSVF